MISAADNITNFLAATKNALGRMRRVLLAKRVFASKSVPKIKRDEAEVGLPLSIPPSGQPSFLIKDVPQGEYKLVVSHHDKQLNENPGAVTGSIFTSMAEQAADLASESGLACDERGDPLIGFGNHMSSEDGFISFARLQLDQDRDWVGFTILSKVSRQIDIRNIRFVPDVIDLEGEPIDLPYYVSKMLTKRRDLIEAEFILYADINFNVVDGSSVWLSSMLSALAASGKTLVLSKKDITSNIIWSNVRHSENILLLSPSDFDASGQTASSAVAIRLIKQLDYMLPKVRRIVIRGLKAAELLCADRQFRARSCIYLTDFYEIEDNQLTVTDEAKKAVTTVATQAGYLLSQTVSIGEMLSRISDLDLAFHAFPPPIPDDLPTVSPDRSRSAPVKIGYAGKITPRWGVDQMLDWTQELSDQGIDIDLHIVANRISDGVGKKNVPGFEQEIREKIRRSGSTHYSDFNRQASMGLMARMDFVWCYRPAVLEDNSLELSTKLVEMVGAGAASLCYPSAINRALLGEDYPYFVRNIHDLAKIIAKGPQALPKGLAERVRMEHSLGNVSIGLKDCVLGVGQHDKKTPTVVVAGHDFKFVDAYISHLKSEGVPVFTDKWEWGGPADLPTTQRLQSNADIIFCEWGLANAVWHSKNKRDGTKLFVRIHLQEINERARKFGFQIDHQKVDGYIFVEEGVRRTAMAMFGIPPNKTILIPNYLLDDEYRDRSNTKNAGSSVRLGMIGIIPQRKRLDLAVDLLTKLLDASYCATLAIKGPRPEELAFMRAPGRIQELDYYNEVYARIKRDPRLAEAVTFEPWGNDVAAWYRDIDFILSPSDFESFHYALADGVLSGCAPLIWPWKGAAEIYHPDWIVQDVNAAFERIVHLRNADPAERLATSQQKRKLLVERFGHTSIFARLSETLGIHAEA